MTKFIIAFLAVAVAGTIFIGYTMPTYDAAQALIAKNGEYDLALGKAKELQDLKQSLLSKYNTFGPDQMDRLNKLLPDHVDNVRLVLDLDSLASRYGIALQNVLISKPDETPTPTATVLGAIGAQTKPYDSMTIQFSAQTTYQNFVTFMSDLETSLRVADIVSLTIQPAPDAQGSTEPVYRFTVSLRTYWLKK